MFENRKDAGKKLAEKLSSFTSTNPVVVGLARGGVVVANEISKKFNLELSILVIKKIPSPIDPEMGIGALAPDSVQFIDWRLAQRLSVDEGYLNAILPQITDQVKNSLQFYRKYKEPIKFENRHVILTDDGAATGGSIKAAVKWLTVKKSKSITLALPIAVKSFTAQIKSSVNDMVVLNEPDTLVSVSQFYKDFSKVTDETLIPILKEGR